MDDDTFTKDGLYGPPMFEEIDLGNDDKSENQTVNIFRAIGKIIAGERSDHAMEALINEVAYLMTQMALFNGRSKEQAMEDAEAITISIRQCMERNWDNVSNSVADKPLIAAYPGSTSSSTH